MPTAGSQLHFLLQTNNNVLFYVLIEPPRKTGGFFMEYKFPAILLKTNIMAEITTQQQQQKTGMVKKLIKKTTRVDLTPMVDLGFLLITFFVFTSTISQPQVMNMTVPNDKDSSRDAIAESTALTVVLGANNTIYYYEGSSISALPLQTTYAPDGIRKVLTDKRLRVISAVGSDRMALIIKPSNRSTFKNLVNVIDESAICMIKRYYIDETAKDDLKIIN